MNPTVFLDTNILVRYLVQDIPHQAVRASALVDSVAAGEINIRLPDTVVFETIYILQRVYSIGKPDTVDALTKIIEHPGVVLDHKESVLGALGFWSRTGGLSFADCYHLVLAEELGFIQIYSFDKQMDRYPGVARVEP